jgi:hypothetical protein
MYLTELYINTLYIRFDRLSFHLSKQYIMHLGWLFKVAACNLNKGGYHKKNGFIDRLYIII